MKRTVLLPHRITVPPQSVTTAGATVSSLNGETMGTTWSVKFVCPSTIETRAVAAGIQRCLDSVIAEMSTWSPISNISAFNQAPAGSWHVLPEDFFHVLHHAIDLARKTDGAFDPTIGPVTNTWGFGPDGSIFEVPDAAFVNGAGTRVNWRALALDVARRRVCQPGGVYLDLSAIAKGFGVDKVARWLRDFGVRDFLVDIGGELRGEGVKPDRQPWWVELEWPDASGNDEDPSRMSTVIALHGLSVATSGDYRRWFEVDGERYAHTFDPRTARPLRNGLASVSVVARSCMEADALATALMVLGLADGLSYAERHGVAALFVLREGSRLDARMSPAMTAMA